MRWRGGGGRVTAVALVSTLMAATWTALVAPPAAADPETVTFSANGSGSQQTFTVPAGVDSLTVELTGGSGGTGGGVGGAGGRGGHATVVVDVDPGDNLSIYVGQRGSDGHASDTQPTSPGGASGRASGGTGETGANAFGLGVNGKPGGGGGSATLLYLNGDLAAVAGGGAGGGGRGAFDGAGGAGGDAGSAGSEGGGSGTNAPGVPGASGSNSGGTGGSGSSGSGGGGGGGGGGGYPGGTGGGGGRTGGGGGSGGGGGANHVNTAVAALDGSWSTRNGPSGNGQVRIDYTVTFASELTIADPGVVVTGQQVGFELGVVAPAAPAPPRGTVQLSATHTQGTTLDLGTEPLLGTGSATVPTDRLTAGEWRLDAEYVPEPGSYVRAAVATRSIIVERGSTVTRLGVPLDPPAFHDEVTLTAQVSIVDPAQGTPTGRVQFLDDGTPIGDPVTIDADGRAQTSTTRLAVGDHEITVAYAGDTEFAPSVSDPQILTVNPGDVSVGLHSPYNPTVVGEEAIFEVTVEATTAGSVMPSGSVQFHQGSDPFGAPVQLDDRGRATLVSDALDPGAHRISAHYLGDTNFRAATSGRVDQVVNPGTVDVRLTSPNSPANAGQEIVFDVTVTRVAPATGTPTGNVEILVNGTALGAPVPIATDGTVQVSTDELPVGEHLIIAHYSGDGRFEPAASGPLTQVVRDQPVVVTLTGPDAAVQAGRSVTLTAQVTTESGAAPRGVVTFYDSGRQIGEVRVGSDGKVKLSTERLPVGLHQFGAHYSGDDASQSGTSATVRLRVRANRVKVKIFSDRRPVAKHRRPHFRSRVTKVSPNSPKVVGTMQYFRNGKALGKPSPVSAGLAGGRIAPLPPGKHRIVAKFHPAPGSWYEPRTSNVVVQRVLKKAPDARLKVRVKKRNKQRHIIRVTARPVRGQRTVTGKIQLRIWNKVISAKRLRHGKARFVVKSDTSVKHVSVSLRPGSGWAVEGKTARIRR